MKSRKLREAMQDSYSFGSIGGLAAGLLMGYAAFTPRMTGVILFIIGVLMIFLTIILHERHVSRIIKKKNDKKIEAAKDAENTE